MTDSLFAELDGLARSGPPPAVDLPGLLARAAARRRRRRLATAAVVVAGALGVGVPLATSTWPGGADIAIPAVPDGASQPVAPSEQRLRQILDDRFAVAAGYSVSTVPSGPFGPDTSVFGRPGRVMAADSVFALQLQTGPPERSLDAHWYAVSPALTDNEGGRLSRGLYPQAPEPDPPATPMTGNPSGRTDALRSAVHFLPTTGDEPNPATSFEGHLLALAWDNAGGIAQLRIQGNRNDEDLALQLDKTVQDLLHQGASSAISPTDTPAGNRWWLRTPPRPGDRTLELMVHERACASGQSAAGRIQPVVDYQTDSIVVTITVPYAGGDQTCPGNPDTPFTLQLPEPVGDRVIKDGRSSPPGNAATTRPGNI